MANPIFYYRAADEASSIAVTSEATDYPKENLQDRSEHTLWKAASTADQNLDVDWGSAIACDYVVLGGHNLYTAGATVAVQYSDDGSTYYTASSGVPSSDDPYLLTFASAAHRYWRVVLSSGSVAYEVATLFIGSKFEHSIQKTEPWQKGYGASIELRKTTGGQKRSNLNGDIFRIWKFKFDQTGETHKNNLETFLNDNKLMHRPFYFQPDGTGNPIFVRLSADNFFYEYDRYQIYNTDEFILEEEI